MNNNRRDFLKAVRFVGAGLFIRSGLMHSVSKARVTSENQEASAANI